MHDTQFMNIIYIAIAAIPGVVSAIALYQTRKTYEKSLDVQHYKVAESLDDEFRDIEKTWGSLLVDVERHRDSERRKRELTHVILELSRLRRDPRAGELLRIATSQLDFLNSEKTLSREEVHHREQLYAWDMLRFLDKVAYYVNHKKIDKEIAEFYRPSYSLELGRLQLNTQHEQILDSAPNFREWVIDNNIAPTDTNQIRQIVRFYDDGRF